MSSANIAKVPGNQIVAVNLYIYIYYAGGASSAGASAAGTSAAGTSAAGASVEGVSPSPCSISTSSMRAVLGAVLISELSLLRGVRSTSP